MEETVTKKTAEEKAQEHTAAAIMNYLIGATYARHSKLSTEEFLEKIGFKDSGKTEEEAIRNGLYNVLVATTAELLASRQSVQQTNGYLKACFNSDFLDKGEMNNGREE